MITVDLSIKEWFFDTELVRRLIGEETRKDLKRWGAFARRVTMNLPKRRSRTSDPGETPTRWVPRRRPSQDPASQKKRRSAADLKNVQYGFDPPWSVVFGPVSIGRKPSVPNKLQFGSNERTRNNRRKRRRLRDGGEIRIGGKTGPTSKQVFDTRLGRSVWVTYAKLRNATQVARANRLNEELYGPWFYGTIKPRPWVNLAIEAAKEKFGEVFSGSLVE